MTRYAGNYKNVMSEILNFAMKNPRLITTGGSIAGSLLKQALTKRRQGRKYTAKGAKIKRGARKTKKRKSSKQLTNKIKKVIRNEEKKDMGLGKYTCRKAKAVWVLNAQANVYLKDQNDVEFGITPLKCLNAAAVLYNAKSDSSTAPNTRTGNFSNMTKIEITGASCEYAIRNNSIYEVTVEISMYKCQRDTNSTVLTNMENLIAAEPTNFTGTVTDYTHNLWRFNDYSTEVKAGKDYSGRVVKRVTLGSGETLNYGIKVGNTILCDRDHSTVTSSLTTYWKGWRTIAFRVFGPVVSNLTTDNALMPQGGADDANKITISEIFKCQILSPTTDGENDNKHHYTEFMANNTVDDNSVSAFRHIDT